MWARTAYDSYNMLNSVGQGFQLFVLHLYLFIFYKFSCQNLDSTEVILGMLFTGRTIFIEAL